jgi:hypothetical protein
MPSLSRFLKIFNILMGEGDPMYTKVSFAKQRKWGKPATHVLYHNKVKPI